MKEFEFDDEIFGQSTCREIRVEEAYEPKQCNSEWFMHLHLNNDQSDIQAIKKYQGDLLFQKQKYSEALSMYQESRQCLPPSYTVLERELTESMALCLLKLDKPDDALTLVQEIMNDNQEKDSSFWHLLSQIYRAMRNIQGEIETLQRCATLHSWNAQFWFSLALAYEKASATCSCVTQHQDKNLMNVYGDRICLMHQDSTVGNCTESSLNGECQPQEVCYAIKCSCPSTDKVQSLTQTEPYDSDEREIRQCLTHVSLGEQVSSVTLSDERTGLQHQSESVSCLSERCSESLKDDSNLTSGRKNLQKECGCTREKVKWRNHVLSFGSLAKTRFFLERAIEASSSFAKDRSKTLLREVNSKIAAHTECGCVQLIDKALEMLYSSVIAWEQPQLDHKQCDTNPKECKQEKLATESVTNSFDFEQKWFSVLLSYMDAN